MDSSSRVSPKQALGPWLGQSRLGYQVRCEQMRSGPGRTWLSRGAREAAWEGHRLATCRLGGLTLFRQLRVLAPGQGAHPRGLVSTPRSGLSTSPLPRTAPLVLGWEELRKSFQSLAAQPAPSRTGGGTGEAGTRRPGTQLGDCPTDAWQTGRSGEWWTEPVNR